MNAQEQAKQIVSRYYKIIDTNTTAHYEVKINISIQLAKIAVQMIINSNPHSNPLNTNVESTMAYWNEVLNELN